MRRTVATFTIPRPLVKLVLIQKHHPSPRYTLDPGLTQVGAHSSHKSNQSATFRFDSGIKWHYPDLSRPAMVCMCSIGVLLQCLPVWSVGLGEKLLLSLVTGRAGMPALQAAFCSQEPLVATAIVTGNRDVPSFPRNGRTRHNAQDFIKASPDWKEGHEKLIAALALSEKPFSCLNILQTRKK